MFGIFVVKAGIAPGGGIVITTDVLQAIAEREPEKYTFDETTGALYLDFEEAIRKLKEITGKFSKLATE